jgi:hypothetical protein
VTTVGVEWRVNCHSNPTPVAILVRAKNATQARKTVIGEGS